MSTPESNSSHPTPQDTETDVYTVYDMMTATAYQAVETFPLTLVYNNGVRLASYNFDLMWDAEDILRIQMLAEYSDGKRCKMTCTIPNEHTPVARGTIRLPPYDGGATLVKLYVIRLTLLVGKFPGTKVARTTDGPHWTRKTAKSAQ